MSNANEKRLRDERHVLASIGSGGGVIEIEQRISKQLTRRDIYEALRRLEDGGAVVRDHRGNLTRDVQAWAEMRRNR